MFIALALLLACTVCSALDNGFSLPVMGYSTWNDCSSMRDNGPTGWCWDAEDHIKNVTRYLVSSGLSKQGYKQINIDAGWLKGRFPNNGTIFEDFEKFPSGMKGFGDWVKAQETYPGSGDHFHYGLYTCRGTCQCASINYSGTGSQGFEAEDSVWMVNAGADYIKVDSCCASQDHATAFSDYGKFRDALNQTGTPVWLSLCGWETWYAPPDPGVGYAGGPSLGNSWRVAGDGSGWWPLVNCINQMASVATYGGKGGWNDPDLLIGPKVYVGGQSDENARAQFTMWSLFPTNLLISQNVLQWSTYALETYSNQELIDINQDPLGQPAVRISEGGDLIAAGCMTVGVPVTAVTCDASNPAQSWSYNASTGAIASTLSDGTYVLDGYACFNFDGAPVTAYPSDDGAGTCGGRNQQWAWGADGRVINANTKTCLDVSDWAGPGVDVWQCNGGSNQNFTYNATTGAIATVASSQGPSKCLQTGKSQTCTNVWGRQLSGGAHALGFVNTGDAAANITCGPECFQKMNITATSLTVRDLWAHKDVGTLTPPFSWTAVVNGLGFAAAFKLTPSA